MLIIFWCDSDITFLRGLHKKFVTVLLFSIINVFWLLNLRGAGGDASFAPQANLVKACFCTGSYASDAHGGRLTHTLSPNHLQNLFFDSFGVQHTGNQ